MFAGHFLRCGQISVCLKSQLKEIQLLFSKFSNCFHICYNLSVYTNLYVHNMLTIQKHMYHTSKNHICKSKREIQNVKKGGNIHRYYYIFSLIFIYFKRFNYVKTKVLIFDELILGARFIDFAINVICLMHPSFCSSHRPCPPLAPP